MKKTILLLISMVLFSGCATNPVTKVYFGDKDISSFKGGTVIIPKLNIRDIKYENLPESTKSEIQNICDNKKIKLISVQKSRELSDYAVGILFFMVLSHNDEYKLEFECINESK